ncbi:MAG: hypothetical protein VB858_12240, partial [Planctomycetaceae bacterium]
LKKLPLANAEKLPDKITPLRFIGERPVTFSRVSVKTSAGNVRRADLEYKATNRANWAMIRGKIQFEFLDGAENVIGQKNSQFRSKRDRIPPGQTGSVSHTFSVPEKTASVRALLIEAEFVDGTVWSAQESQTGIWNGLRQKQFRGAPERAGHRSGRLEQSSGRLLEPAADPWQNCFRTSCSVVMMFPCFLAGPDAGYGSCVLYA